MPECVCVMQVTNDALAREPFYSAKAENGNFSLKDRYNMEYIAVRDSVFRTHATARTINYKAFTTHVCIHIIIIFDDDMRFQHMILHQTPKIERKQ